MGLYLYHNDDELYKVIDGGIVTFPNGDVMSPAYEGWSNELGYSIRYKDEPIPVAPELSIEEKRELMVCSRLQAKATLFQYGLLDQVEELVKQSDFLTQLAWNEAIEIRRNSPIILNLKEQLKLPDGTQITDEILDEMFRQAMSFTV
jgi:hypothetical protein